MPRENVSRVRIVRAGVVLCVAASCFVGGGRLDDAVAVFDFQADANVAATFGERMYPDILELDGEGRVFEDARLWMPEDAEYRVVTGPRPGDLFAGSLRTFLDVLLVPRRRTADASAPWAFCYGCTETTLGPEYEVVSASGDGFLFARRRA